MFGSFYAALRNRLLGSGKPKNGQKQDLGIIWLLWGHFSGHFGVLRISAIHRAKHLYITLVNGSLVAAKPQMARKMIPKKPDDSQIIFQAVLGFYCYQQPIAQRRIKMLSTMDC